MSWIAAVAVTLLCAAARAQDAPPAEAVAPPPTPLVPVPAEIVAAPPAAPPGLVQMPELTPEERRQVARRARLITRLNRAMEREGGDYSEERYEMYGRRIAVGAVLIGLGAASALTALVCAFYDLNQALSAISYSEDVESDDETSSDGGDDGYVSGPVILSLVAAGVAMIGLGVPLLATGVSGRHRQQLIRRKDEILAPFDPRAVRVSLSLTGDPARGAGGLTLRVAF
jgi:hypothetical protein